MAVVVCAALGAVVACALAGRVQVPVGPFDATISARPSLSGGTLVRLGPLGTVELDTHDAPLTMEVRVDDLRVDEAEAIARDLKLLDGIEDDIARDARAGLWALVRRAVAAAVVGGAIGGLAASRRWRSLALGGVVGALLAGSLTAVSARSFRPEAVAEPRYTGLLTVAPTAVGDARALVSRYGEYRAQLAEFVGNVLALYRVSQDLPTLGPTDGLVRVLHVSDVHLNPQAYDLMRELVGEFDVDAIVDSGDSTDFGTSVESNNLDDIGRLGVPYLWVKGNHDSGATAASIAAQPNAVVLASTATEVEGIRFFGVADPRFTPDKSRAGGAAVEEAAAVDFAPRVARLLRDAEPPDVDVLVVHDERIAGRSGFLVPLVLAGHTHEPRLGAIGDATLVVQGSTGGAGRRGVGEDADSRQPLLASVLYFDRASRRLVAYDQVAVEGLGNRGVRVERRTVADAEADPSEREPAGPENG
jgi:predicted phosphodiesterase